MSGLYILDEKGNPIECDIETPDGLEKYSQFIRCENFEQNRRVAENTIFDGCKVSTVFLSIDHNFSGIGPPVVYETMVFGLPDEDEICERYTTRELAIEGHNKICADLRKRLP